MRRSDAGDDDMQSSTIAIALALTGIACSRVQAGEPVSYLSNKSVPENVDAFPQAVYEGHTVYYVNDRWMYRDRGGWAYYLTEPPALYAHRATPRQTSSAPTEQ